YGGAEAVRLLATHPEVRLAHVTAETQKGRPIADLYPNLRGFVDLVTEPLDAAAIGRDSDLVIVSLPSGKAMEIVPELLERRGRPRVLGDQRGCARLRHPGARAYGGDRAGTVGPDRRRRGCGGGCPRDLRAASDSDDERYSRDRVRPAGPPADHAGGAGALPRGLRSRAVCAGPAGWRP